MWIKSSIEYMTNYELLLLASISWYTFIEKFILNKNQMSVCFLSSILDNYNFILSTSGQM